MLNFRTNEVQSAFRHVIAPDCRVVSYAAITPTIFDSQSGTYQGAVYDSSGALVFHSLRPGSPISTFRPDIPISRYRGPLHDPLHFETAIYGGHFFYAWGHFLIETLSTAAISDMLPDAPVVFSPFGFTGENDWTERYQAHVAPLMKAAGWGDRPIIVSARAMTATTLHIPQRLTAFGIASPAIHPAITGVYGRIQSALGRPLTDEAVLVMRASNHRRWHPSEEALYEALKARGVTAIFPQEMTASEQVSVISGAKTLIGFTGSVLHNSVFMRDGTQVVEIGDGLEAQAADRTQSELCSISGQGLAFIPGFEGGQPRSAEDILAGLVM